MEKALTVVTNGGIFIDDQGYCSYPNQNASGPALWKWDGVTNSKPLQFVADALIYKGTLYYVERYESFASHLWKMNGGEVDKILLTDGIVKDHVTGVEACIY